MKHKITCLTALLCLCSVAHAQYAVDQAKSLKGVESVSVVFGPGVAGNSALHNTVTLELRKTGLRIETDNSDIILNVSSTVSANTLSADVQIRLDVEQVVVIPRTHEELQLVTWFYEDQDRVGNAQWSQELLQDKVMAGVNQFLNDFLTANGR